MTCSHFLTGKYLVLDPKMTVYLSGTHTIETLPTHGWSAAGKIQRESVTFLQQIYSFSSEKIWQENG